jgi:hypothetical protein
MLAMSKPTVAFDTSTLNRIMKDSDSEPFIAAILAGFEVQLPEMSVGEIYAHPDPLQREKLYVVCRRFLAAGGRCLYPAHWILDLLIRRFHKDPLGFNWGRVEVRALGVEKEINEGTILNNELMVSEQSAIHRKLQNEFEKTFGERRARFNDLVAKGEALRPKTFQEWVEPSRHDGGHYWRFARGIYVAAFGQPSPLEDDSLLTDPPDEDTLKRFDDCCPPFRAFVTATSLSFYDRCVRPPTSQEFSAGRNDQMMSIYLPYTDQFITAEKYRMQEKCLREVAEAAKIPAAVRSYDDFCQSFLIGP